MTSANSRRAQQRRIDRLIRCGREEPARCSHRVYMSVPKMKPMLNRAPPPGSAAGWWPLRAIHRRACSAKHFIEGLGPRVPLMGAYTDEALPGSGVGKTDRLQLPALRRRSDVRLCVPRFSRLRRQVHSWVKNRTACIFFSPCSASLQALRQAAAACQPAIRPWLRSAMGGDLAAVRPLRRRRQ